MKFTKILAIALIALMMLSAFAACDKGNKDEQTTGADTQAPTESTDSTAQDTTTPETTEPGEDTTEPGEDTTTPDEDTTAPEEDTTAPEEDTTAPNEDTTTPDEETTPEEDTTAPEDEIKIITIAEALELCGEEGNITTERYYIRATVESILNAAYGQMIITDATGSIEVYGTYSADGEINYSEMEDKPYRDRKSVV